ncbi:MAG: transporter substrate-binding domain-containing protein, partial [Candidatus Latescibacteria bacterium]|nr:transporter substrate-binding domain-containing protein [Candidatus Latescibacterota bacterium]
SCDPSSDQPGILIEVAKIILEQAGHTVVYKEMNWARAIKEIKKGTFDGLVGAYKSDAPGFIFPAQPIMISQMSFFISEDDPWKFEAYDDLKGRKISVINEYSYGKKFDAYIQKNSNKGDQTIQELSGADATKRRIKLMALGRIDTILEDWLVFPYEIKTHQEMAEFQKFKSFKNAGNLLEAGSYIAFSPNKESSKLYADLLSKGLQDLKASGKFEEIINKYK